MSGEGIDLLRSRVDALPAVLRRAAALPEPEFGRERFRRVLTTGLGSSEAHARYLASVLSQELGLPAAFVPSAALSAPPPVGSAEDLLVVFSQGLSPNARIVFRHAGRYARVAIVTALDAAPDEDAERDRALAALREREVLSLPLGVDRERGQLARVQGPMAGYVVALSIARALGRRAGLDVSRCAFDVEAVCARVEGATASLARAFPRDEALAPRLEGRLLLLCAGGYAERASHLATKVQEGLWQRKPGLWDLLDFSHGPFQEHFEHEATCVFLARGAPGEAEGLAGLREMLVEGRHELRVLESTLPGPLAIFEHEAQFSSLMLRYSEERRLALGAWPGHGKDEPLYAVAESAGVEAREVAAPKIGAALAGLRWPELAQRLEQGQRTAILALGSTEQHGPHLPFATDTWIAEQLALRFCARVDEAVALPALAFGCASEHMAFPGTLHLRPATLEALLSDLLRSLAVHGFERAFVFSAHGGNLEALRAMQSTLAAAAAPLALCVHAEAGLADLWHEASAAYGITPAASGQHAGEFETSIVAALAPGAVDRAALAVGHLVGEGEAQELFYPSLRDHAANGVVGDPRAFDAARAGAYLDRWADALVANYRAAFAGEA